MLNPLSSFDWDSCSSLPVGMANAQAVLLNGQVYVGGGDCDTTDINDDYSLYI